MTKLIETGIEDTLIIDSEKPGPTVTVMGGLHGDEESGIEIVDELMTNGIELTHGRIKAAMGNPLAVVAGKRFVEKDANKCFADNPDLAKFKEYQRVQELKKLMSEFGGTDVLVDTHNVRTQPEPPAPDTFLTCPNPGHKLASTVFSGLQVKDILTGPGLFVNGEAVYSDTFAATIGALGITFESGSIATPKTLEAKLKLKQMLVLMGMIEADFDPAEFNPTIWNAYGNIIAQNDFSFMDSYTSWQALPQSTYFAYDINGAKITRYFTPVDSVILFPKSPELIKNGEDVCLLAAPIELGDISVVAKTKLVSKYS